MSTYQQRHQQLTDAHAAADRLYPDAGDRWQDARRAAALAVLLDAAGHPCRDLQHVVADPSGVVDQIDLLDPAPRRTLLWLAQTADASTVAGVADLLDHAAARSLAS